MLVEFQLLQTLVDIGETSSFRGAALRRHITPSAVGQRIKLLEHQIGVPLFERLGQRNRLTPQGMRLFQAAQQGFAPILEIVAELRDETTTVRGSLRIAGPLPFCRIWLRPRLMTLRNQHPELVPELSYFDSDKVEKQLLDGELDLGIFAVPIRSPQLASVAIYEAELLAVAAPRYLERAGVPQTGREFAQHVFLAFNAELSMISEWWHACFGRREPLPGRIACRIANLDELLAWAEDGYGIAVLPNYTVSSALRAKRLRLLTPLAKRAIGSRATYQLRLAWRARVPETPKLRTVREALRSIVVATGRRPKTA